MIKISSPINLKSYVRPNPHTLIKQTNKYVTNGVDNEFFYYVEDCYLGSPTAQSIIDNIANYIIADGLSVVSGNIDVNSIISEEDLRNFCTDFKMQGMGYFQVIYSYSFEKKIAKLIYVPTKCIAIDKQPDLSDDIECYWYCFDWKLKYTFKPYKIPAFGYGKNNESELLCIKRQSPQPLFALPDWNSGLQSAQVEGELANFYIKHIENNFSAGKIINIYQGKEWTDEAMIEAKNAITNNLTGSNNAGVPIISFNDSPESKTTVENIDIVDAYEQFKTLSDEALRKIMQSNKVNDPALFGLPLPSGFSSVAEQMVQSLKILYRSQINPMRKIILSRLETALKLNDPNVKLEFIDYEEMRPQDQNTQTQMSSLKLKDLKIGFDYDGTASTKKGKEMIDNAINNGDIVYIISARAEDTDLLTYATEHGIPHSRVYATGSNTNKEKKVNELHLDTFFDNNKDVIDNLPNVGKLFTIE